MLLTTSRRPTDAMRTLCRDLSCTFPNVVRINRGKLSLEEMAEKALELGIEKVVVIDRWEKGMGIIEFYEVGQDGLKQVSPIVHVSNVKFRRDFVERTVRERKVKSIAIAVSSKRRFETKKFEDFLSSFFEIPVVLFQEALIGGCDAVMQISADSTNRITATFRYVPELIEIGPQIAISKLVWKPNR